MNNHDELQRLITDYHQTGKGGHNNVVYLEKAIQNIIDRAVLEKLNYIRGFGERGGHDVYCRTIGEALLEELESQGR